MILVGQRRPKQRHDAIAHDLVHRALVAVHGRHQALQHRVEELPRFLGIAVGQQFHGALQVGEQHRDLLALAFQGAPGGENLLGQIAWRVGLRGTCWRLRGARRCGQRCATAAAEFFLWLVREAAGRAGQGQRRPALGTETAPGAVLGLAAGTLHRRTSCRQVGGKGHTSLR